MTNIAELLRDAPKGKLYSPLFGEVELICVNVDNQIIVETERHDRRYFAYNGTLYMCKSYPHSECLLFPSKDVRTWDGWQVPIEPKFKVGDWIVKYDEFGAMIRRVDKLLSESYLLLDKFGVKYNISFYQQDTWRLWTIEDAKVGDVLANDHHILILKELDYDWYTNGTPYSVRAYCGIKPNGNFELGKEHWCFCGTLHMHPATKEQRDQLFSRMKEAGYQWDTDKKELKKIKPHYDISNFKPFDRVLIRVGNKSKWSCDIFSHYDKAFHCVGTDDWSQCIPYEGNEALLGTNNMCDECYINW